MNWILFIKHALTVLAFSVRFDPSTIATNPRLVGMRHVLILLHRGGKLDLFLAIVQHTFHQYGTVLVAWLTAAIAALGF